MRRRKSGAIVGTERVRLRERRGLLDSRVRGNDMGSAGAPRIANPRFIPQGRPEAGANSQ
jgi:hypothetical protein